ncbi:MAG: site-2 protease family protein [Candidatus Bathyarchaeia archaeon]|nr:site-2 protease family protein [Candidatus Bathyarchaeia archaeon]
MSEIPNEKAETPFTQQTDFERITTLVSAEFQIEEALIEHNVPTYYLKQPQETKQTFLRLLKNLETMNLIAILRKSNGKTVLKIIPKPPTKPSNILVNWILFFATIGTTFLTGYMLSGDLTDPLVGGATFTIAIMAVLGMHEMGHKLTASKKGIEATPPYFIPGPPPFGGMLAIGTFGAVIMQKSLPPNKDALFDVGASGPIVGFILAIIVSIVGLLFSPMLEMPPGGINGLPAPLIFELFAIFVVQLQPNYYILLHPVAFAGWVGMVITMLNLLPAAMLDGGHVARSLVGEKTRSILTFLSILLLIVSGFWPMAIFVLFISTYRHPGPLDDVSSLSTGRKLLTIAVIGIFVLCSVPFFPTF